MYTYTVELKSGPTFAFLVLKAGPSFFLFLKISVSLQKEEDKKRRKNKNNNPILALKTGPIMLRNILGPIFNASLDQF